MSETSRETKTLQVGQHQVTVNVYVTGRELRAIESAMMDKLEMKQRGGEQEISGFRGSMIGERQDMQIKAVVVAIDGNTENIVEQVLDLPAPEYNEIMAYVSELTEPKKEPADNSKPLPTT